MIEHAEAILHAAVAAADVRTAVIDGVRHSSALQHVARIHVIAIGKAAAPMTHAALAALQRVPVSTLVVAPHGADTGDLDALHAAHPFPDRSSLVAGEAVTKRIGDAAQGDVVLVLLSGGASSLCAAPAPGITIDDYATVVKLMMKAGADIRELNTVRAHIDSLKGGGMAALAAPARVIGLLVSDVVGSPLDVIASGPLSPPSTSRADALGVLRRFSLPSVVPPAVRAVLESTDDTARSCANADVRVVLDNGAAMRGAAGEAARMGYDVRTGTQPLTGPARDAGALLVRSAVRIGSALRPGDRPVCLVHGGETTVVVTGTGVGGRNQELVLAAALALDTESPAIASRITIGSIGTDGIDGSTEAAGAIIDGSGASREQRVRLGAANALANNDSHTFFDAAGGLIVTGPTGTNVMDVQVVLVASA